MTDIETAKRYFFDAVALLDAGDYRNGAIRLREALDFAPDNISILTNLAGALMLQGGYTEARVVAERIIAVDGGNLGARLVIADCLAKEGRHADALATLDTIIALEPRVAEHHSNRSAALNRLGRHDEALASSDQAIALKPGLAAAHVNRGNSLADLKRNDEALPAFERAASLDPRLAEAWLGRGNLVAAAGRNDDALAAFDEARVIAPKLAGAWSGRGNALTALGRYDDALAAHDQALSLNSGFVLAWIGRGTVHALCMRANEAIADYDKAVALDPRAVQAWISRGNFLAVLQRYDEAAAAFDNAVAIDPGLAEAWNGKAAVLVLHKRFEEAVAAYDKALAIDPNLPYAQGSRLVALMRLCDWTRYESERISVVSGVRCGARVILPFDMIGIATSAADQLACARICVADRYPPLPAPPVRRPPRRDDKINIAYVSADFGYHPVSVLIAGLFEHHDRSRFRTTAISFGPDNDTAMRRRIKGAFDNFEDADRLSDAAVAKLLNEREIDIAIDLMGFTSASRPGIFARRAAPIQVNYLGLPATMGASYIDYIIADDHVVPPEFEPYYAERVVRLPDAFQVNDEHRPLPSRIAARREVGLPEDAFVFCCFSNLSKIIPEIFDVWMRLLRQTSNAVIWLLAEGAVTERNLRREAESRGVAPERLVFAPRVPYAEYLSRYRAADLFIDTYPFNGGTTVSDALWMGLPVVTLSGETFASRMAGSLLGAAGFPEFAARSIAGYEHLALTLAADRQLLATTRTKLASGRSNLPLFDTGRFCRHIETAYATMHEQLSRGEAPASFAIARSAGE